MANKLNTYRYGATNNDIHPHAADIIQSMRFYDARIHKRIMLQPYGLTDALIGTNALGGLVTAASSGTVKVSTAPGKFTVVTHTDDNDTVCYTDSALSLFPADTLYLGTKLKMAAIATRIHEFGLIDHLTYASLTEKATLSFNTESAVSTTNWVLTVTDGTTTDAVDTGVKGSTSEITLEMEVDASGYVYAWIDGAQVSYTPTVALTAATGFSWALFTQTLSAATKAATFDYVEVITNK